MKAGGYRVGDRFWLDTDKDGRIPVMLRSGWEWGLVHRHVQADAIRLDTDQECRIHAHIDADLDPYEGP